MARVGPQGHKKKKYLMKSKVHEDHEAHHCFFPSFFLYFFLSFLFLFGKAGGRDILNF